MFNFLSKKDQGEKMVLKIEGMHCTSCAMNIDGELEEMNGVISATTSYAKSQTSVQYNPELVKADEMLDTIKKLGYSASEKAS